MVTDAAGYEARSYLTRLKAGTIEIQSPTQVCQTSPHFKLSLLSFPKMLILVRRYKREPYYLWLNVTMTVYEEPSQIPFKTVLIYLPAKRCHDRNGTTDWSLGQLVLTICRVPMCSWTFHGRPHFQISFPLSDHMFQSLVCEMWIHPWTPPPPHTQNKE